MVSDAELLMDHDSVHEIAKDKRFEMREHVLLWAICKCVIRQKQDCCSISGGFVITLLGHFQTSSF